VNAPLVDEDGPPTAIDQDPPPPPFDLGAWLEQRGITGKIPEDTYCEEALATTPPRPEMLRCVWVDQPSEPIGPMNPEGFRPSFYYWVSHTVLLTPDGKKLRKVFDVIHRIGPLDPPMASMRDDVKLVVRVEEGAAAIVVEDSPDRGCKEAFAKLDELVADAPHLRAGVAADRRMWSKACNARGRWVFQGGRFVKAR
jgi:hypothetical protein